MAKWQHDCHQTSRSLGCFILWTVKTDSLSLCLVVRKPNDFLAWHCSCSPLCQGTGQMSRTNFNMWYITLVPGLELFFHFSGAFNTMRPALLGEKSTVRPQYMHTFKAVCQTRPEWAALGPHRGRDLSLFLLTLHCGLQSSPMTLPMSDGISTGN